MALNMSLHLCDEHHGLSDGIVFGVDETDSLSTTEVSPQSMQSRLNDGNNPLDSASLNVYGQETEAVDNVGEGLHLEMQNVGGQQGYHEETAGISTDPVSTDFQRNQNWQFIRAITINRIRKAKRQFKSVIVRKGGHPIRFPQWTVSHILTFLSMEQIIKIFDLFWKLDHLTVADMQSCLEKGLRNKEAGMSE